MPPELNKQTSDEARNQAARVLNLRTFEPVSLRSLPTASTAAVTVARASSTAVATASLGDWVVSSQPLAVK